MPSRKRHTTSKSGESPQSTTKATSTKAASSLQTAAASSVQQIREALTLDGRPPNNQLDQLRRQLHNKREAITAHNQGAMPRNRLLANRWRQRAQRLQRELELLEEAVTELSN